jgi:hypothetical protein
MSLFTDAFIEIPYFTAYKEPGPDNLGSAKCEVARAKF